MIVEKVQRSPSDDRLQRLSNEDFLAPTNSKKTYVTVLPYSRNLQWIETRIKGEASFRDSYFHDHSNLQSTILLWCMATMAWACPLQITFDS